MSYSFTFTVENKAAAAARVTQELAQVVAGQPIHAKDVPAVQFAALAFLDAMQEGPVCVAIYGSVSTPNWSDPAAALSQAQVNINISAG